MKFILAHWPLTLVCVAMIVAAVIDGRKLKVPNWLTFPLVLGGWLLGLLHNFDLLDGTGVGGIGSALAGTAMGFLLLFPILAIGGGLNPKMGGPGIYPEVPPEVMETQSMPGHGWGKSPPEDRARRSVYIHVKRSLLVPILEVFDLAEADRSSPSRFSTTQPTQALAMLNGAFLNEQAAALSARLLREADDRAYRLLEEHRDDLERLTEALIEREVLTYAEIEELIGKRAGAPADLPAGEVVASLNNPDSAA